MPSETAKQSSSYRSAIALPESILDSCAAKAKAAGKSVEDWITLRLRACANHDAKRGLYFNDTQRERLEMILGGTTLDSADDALKLLTNRYTLTVADEQGITVEEGAYTVLKERSAELSIPLPDIIRTAVADGLSIAAWGMPQ